MLIHSTDCMAANILSSECNPKSEDDMLIAEPHKIQAY